MLTDVVLLRVVVVDEAYDQSTLTHVLLLQCSNGG